MRGANGNYGREQVTVIDVIPKFQAQATLLRTQ